ncbi:MAG TPA: hypothetical protein VGI93_04725 [Steroidobacteraceae bacterium]|jgi:hypothetical protein
MNEREKSADRLEQQVDRVLSNLPLRRAPAALEQAVLGEIARRAALPWYRRSFGQWPIPARVAFLVTSVALIVLSVLASSLNTFGAVPLSWSRPAVTGVSTLFGSAAVVARAIPPAWLYLGLGFGAVLYVLMFGLGAFAYRTLYLAPLNGR